MASRPYRPGPLGHFVGVDVVVDHGRQPGTTAVTSGPSAELVDQWVAADPNRFIPALQVGAWRASGRFCLWPRYQDPRRQQPIPHKLHNEKRCRSHLGLGL